MVDDHLAAAGVPKGNILSQNERIDELEAQVAALQSKNEELDSMLATMHEMEDDRESMLESIHEVSNTLILLRNPRLPF